MNHRCWTLGKLWQVCSRKQHMQHNAYAPYTHIRTHNTHQGNFCGALLGYFGADVIKVEPPGKGDALRSLRALDDSGTALWWRTYVCVHLCMCVYLCMCVLIYVCLCMCTYVHVCGGGGGGLIEAWYTAICLNIHDCTHTHTSLVHVYTTYIPYTHMHINMHIHIHSYTCAHHYTHIHKYNTHTGPQQAMHYNRPKNTRWACTGEAIVGQGGCGGGEFQARGIRKMGACS